MFQSRNHDNRHTSTHKKYTHIYTFSQDREYFYLGSVVTCFVMFCFKQVLQDGAGSIACGGIFFFSLWDRSQPRFLIPEEF